MTDQQPAPEQREVVYVERARNGMATAALVLGIIGVVFGLIPLTFFIALICGILATIFGFIGWRKGKGGAGRKTMAVWGLALGIVAIASGIAGGTILTDTAEDISTELKQFDDQPATVRIEARRGVCWSGSIGNSTKEGCGSKSIRIRGESIVVANAQKQSEEGKLTMILEIDGQEIDRSTTTAAFGVVQVSEG